jgi:hypothetical protein
MSLLDINSHECLKSELDLFQVPPTQTSIGDSYWVNYYPITSLDRNGPIEFTIKTSSDVYLDLSQTILYTKTRILKSNGNTFSKTASTESEPEENYVSPINYFNATQFKNIEVYVNGRLASTSDNLSAYRSYLETLLTYSKNAKDNQLRCGMFYADTGDDLDWFDTAVTDEDETKNMGLTMRFDHSKHSSAFETWGRVHSDLLCQNKFFPGGHEIRIKFQRNDASFSLLSKSASQSCLISTDTAILMVRHCKIAPHILESHTKALQTKNIKYPIRKIAMQFFTRGSGRNDLSEPNLVSGLLPTRVVIGLVRSDAFNGSPNKNPFNFQHFNVQNVVLRKNGNPLPMEEIVLDYENNCYYQGYMSLVQATGTLYQDQGFAITPEQYKNGYVLYGFDISNSPGPCNSLDLLEEGKLSLEIKLKTPTTVSVTTVVYLEYESIIEIDKEGNIFSDG